MFVARIAGGDLRAPPREPVEITLHRPVVLPGARARWAGVLRSWGLRVVVADGDGAQAARRRRGVLVTHPSRLRRLDGLRVPSAVGVAPEGPAGLALLRATLDHHHAALDAGAVVQPVDGRTEAWWVASTVGVGRSGAVRGDDDPVVWRVTWVPLGPSPVRNGRCVVLGRRGRVLLPMEADGVPANGLVLAWRFARALGWRDGRGAVLDLRDTPLPWQGSTTAACPCCSHRTLARTDDDGWCVLCGWEDDGTVDPDAWSDCNGCRLGDARRAYKMAPHPAASLFPGGHGGG